MANWPVARLTTGQLVGGPFAHGQLDSGRFARGSTGPRPVRSLVDCSQTGQLAAACSPTGHLLPGCPVAHNWPVACLPTGQLACPPTGQLANWPVACSPKGVLAGCPFAQGTAVRWPGHPLANWPMACSHARLPTGQLAGDPFTHGQLAGGPFTRVK